MKYYKIVTGFGNEDFIPITEDELPKALALFIEGKGRGVFLDGAIRAQDITKVVPDWHKAKGWNRGWKLGPEDYAEVRPMEREYQETYQLAKSVAELALRTSRHEILSQPLNVSAGLIDAPKATQISDQVKEIAGKMKI